MSKNPNPAKSYEPVNVVYTKKDGETSTREVIIISEPKPMYLCLQTSELSLDQKTALTAMLQRHKEELKHLCAESGAAFKSFIKENLQILEG